MGERRREGNTKLYYLWFLHIIYTVCYLFCFWGLKCWILHLGLDTLAFLCSLNTCFLQCMLLLLLSLDTLRRDENASVFLLSFKKFVCLFYLWCFIYQMSLLVIIYHYYLLCLSIFFYFTIIIIFRGKISPNWTNICLNVPWVIRV